MKSALSSMVSEQWHAWLTKKALPFWIEKGFNFKTCFFYERLLWDGVPSVVHEQRLMVQARQIVTYGRAYFDGLYDGRSYILECIQKLEEAYYHADGQKGWGFSLILEDKTLNPLRDLYGHAFILLAYGWVYKMTQDVHYREIAKKTALEIDEIFKAEIAGYITEYPAASLYRSQNPHMHLLEAYLLLFEVTEDSFYFEEAGKIVSLAEKYFIDRKTGFLFEFLDHSLNFLHEDKKHYIEPGHQFEWAWLLQDYMRLARGCLEEERRQSLILTVKHLLKNVLSYGVERERGLVWDGLNAKGEVISHNVRIWPQTEFLRVLMTSPQYIFEEILEEQERCALIEKASVQMFERFLKKELHGGWVDRLDDAGQAIGDYMPASSFYHIYSAAREFL